MAHLFSSLRHNLNQFRFVGIVNFNIKGHGHDMCTTVNICKQNNVASTHHELKSPGSILHHLEMFGTSRRVQHRHASSKPKPKPDSLQNAKRLRILAYVGGFLSLQLGVILGRDYYRKKKIERKATRNPQPIIQEYVDQDLGKTAKMFYYKGYLLPFFAKDSLKEIDDFTVRNSDVFVSSFPKSGTTWVQEIVYLIESGLDSSANEDNMEKRFPFLEFVYPGINDISRQEGKRMIKTHMPHCMLPVEVRQGMGKVIYIARNPKDVSVSYFHYFRMMSEVGFTGNFEEFFTKFINDKVPYGPWWQHVRDYWDHRTDSNILFLTYEELQQDLVGGVESIAHFLGRTLTPAQAAAIAGRCSFKAMKQNPTTNYSWWDELGLRRKGEAEFMRKGIVGDWQNYYTAAMKEEVDEMCASRLGRRKLYLIDKLN